VCMIMGKVNHMYSYVMTTAPWVIVKHYGTVVFRHCACMAGLGETHLSALLYWMECMKRKHEEESCVIGIVIQCTIIYHEQ